MPCWRIELCWSKWWYLDPYWGNIGRLHSIYSRPKIFINYIQSARKGYWNVIRRGELRMWYYTITFITLSRYSIQKSKIYNIIEGVFLLIRTHRISLFHYYTTLHIQNTLSLPLHDCQVRCGTWPIREWAWEGCPPSPTGKILKNVHRNDGIWGNIWRLKAKDRFVLYNHIVSLISKWPICDFWTEPLLET